MESETKDTPTAVQSEQAKENERLPDVKAGRVIIRNLGFDLREKHLKNLFSKFGEIVNVNVPLNSTDNRSRGFGFIEFSTKD
jgi:RNA recognition motif-containing protein